MTFLRVAAVLLSLTLSNAHDIVTSHIAESSTRLAAIELRRYLFDIGIHSTRARIVTAASQTDVMDLFTAKQDVFVLMNITEALHLGMHTQQDFSELTEAGSYTIEHHVDENKIKIIGVDSQGVLYGVYSYLERHGCSFTTAGPTLPARGMAKVLPNGFRTTDSPVFTTRGLQPFHDFAEGPDWWSEDEHKRVQEAIVSMKGNLIGFHTYPLKEPAVWVGLKEDVLPGGNVTGGSYSTNWANTNEPGGAWGYNVFNTSLMGFGASQIFEDECFGHPTVSGNPELCPKPISDDANDELFNRVGLLWKNTFAHAKNIGVQTILGTEIPLSIPKGPPSPPPTPSPNTLLALQIWYSQSRNDYFVTATNCDECENVYKFLGVTGWIYAGNVPGTIPLCTYYNAALNDNMLDVCNVSHPGYGVVRIEGYAPTTATTTTMPLAQYNNSVGKHYAVDSNLKNNATAAGFKLESTIANVFSSGPAPNPPSNSQNATLYYEGIFTRLDELLGDNLTYYWGWTPEGWEWSKVSITNPVIQNAVEDTKQMQAAHDAVKPSFGLASCGWTVGPLGARWYYDTVLPSTWAISSIDMDVGNTPVDPAYANITHRSRANKWAIPWAEDDPGLTAPELWVNRSLEHARDANKYGVGGLLSIHWRTRNTSPQILSAHAVAWNISLTSTDHWSIWALGEFGDPTIASEIAKVFESIDSFLTPRPVDWVGGPGGFKPGCSNGNYNIADNMTAIRPAMLAAVKAGQATLDHLENFDFWAGSLVYMRSIHRFTCDWANYNSVIASVQSIKDPKEQQAAAIAKGVPARISLMTNFTTLMEDLLSTVSTIEGSGTVYDVLSHSSWSAIGPEPTAALEKLTGSPLPANALAPSQWSSDRAPIARVQVIRTMLAPGEPLRIRAMVLAPVSAGPKAVTLFWAPHGTAQWQDMPLSQAPAVAGVVRFVYTGVLPPQTSDFQWYVNVTLPPAPAGGYPSGLGIPAGTMLSSTSVNCFVPPGGAAAPQSVVIMPSN